MHSKLQPQLPGNHLVKHFIKITSLQTQFVFWKKRPERSKIMPMLLISQVQATVNLS